VDYFLCTLKIFGKSNRWAATQRGLSNLSCVAFLHVHPCCMHAMATACLDVLPRCFALPCRALLCRCRCLAVQAIAPLALVPCCAARLRCPATLPLAPKLAFKPHLSVQPCRAVGSVKSRRRVQSRCRVFPRHLFIDRRPRSHATDRLLSRLCSVLPPGAELSSPHASLSIGQDRAMPCHDSPSRPGAICAPHASAPVSTSTPCPQSTAKAECLSAITKLPPPCTKGFAPPTSSLPCRCPCSPVFPSPCRVQGVQGNV
jgi:hypothetical protein